MSYPIFNKTDVSSLTLKDTAEFVAKATATQQKSLDSLAKVVLDNRGATGYLLVEQGGVCAVATATCCTGIDASGGIETQLPKFTVLSLLA